MLYERQLNKPTWETDVANPQTGYIITDTPSTMSADPYRCTKIPVLFFAATVFNEIRYLTEKRQDEIALFCFTKELQDNFPHYLVYDYYIPKQEVTSTLTSVDGEDMTNFTNSIKPHFPNNGMHKYLTHLHLHPNMGVTWSGTDLNQQNNKGELGFESDYRMYVCINSTGKLHASFVNYRPVFYRIEDIALGLYVADKYVPQQLTKERKAELDLLVGKQVSKKVYSIPAREYNFDDYKIWQDRMDVHSNYILPAEIDKLKPTPKVKESFYAEPQDITMKNVQNLLHTLNMFNPAKTPNQTVLAELQKYEVPSAEQVAKVLTTVFENFELLDGKNMDGATGEVIDALEQQYFDDRPLNTLQEYLSLVHQLEVEEFTHVRR